MHCDHTYAIVLTLASRRRILWLTRFSLGMPVDRNGPDPHGHRRSGDCRLGVGLQMTYIGSPMIFAGEELGVQGRDGEDSRRPMRWDRRGDWDTGTLQMFKDLIAIRHAHPALRRGGLRWVLAADDALGYLRETADERILVVLSRSPGPEHCCRRPY